MQDILEVGWEISVQAISRLDPFEEGKKRSQWNCE